MKFEKYKKSPFTHKPNKIQMQPIEMPFEQMDEFNEIYAYARAHFMKVEPTKSKAMPYNGSCKMHSRYMIVQSKTKIELTIVCYAGCYRFLIGNMRNEAENPVSGKQAVRAIYKAAKELGIDLSRYAVSPEEGQALKTEITQPHIEMLGMPGRVYTNVHHLDLNSSYASRIIEKHSELKPLYESMYAKRHENDGYYKHVLTNSIGCWQSEFCPDVNNAGRLRPYQFAGLSKEAVNGTREIIEEYVDRLKKAGRRVLLTNTDGIWYQGDLYHDEREGNKLGQWKNDHKDCRLLMKSKGAYQFMENGEVHTVVRGITTLDREKDRKDWAFGDIFNDVEMEYYTFDEREGVKKHVKSI